MTRLRKLTGLIIGSCLLWTASAAADPITELNVIAAETIFAGGRPAGAAPLLDFAMVHAAIHDAVQAYEKRFQPYAVRIRDASGSRVAAVAAAARDVLVNRFPAQEATIHAKYLLFLANHGLTEADLGRLVGEAAATAIIARRAGDGSYPDPPPAARSRRHGGWRVAADADGARGVFRTVAGCRRTVHDGLQRTVSRPSSTGAAAASNTPGPTTR